MKIKQRKHQTTSPALDLPLVVLQNLRMSDEEVTKANRLPFLRTRLFQAGVDEQLIMGHRSVDGVWSYKRTNHEQRLSLSDVMTSESNDST